MNEAYKKDLVALRLLHPDWDSKSEADRQAIHHTFMWTIDAAVKGGIVDFPAPPAAASVEGPTGSVPQIRVKPLAWSKENIAASGDGSRGDFGGWTMTAATPLKNITIDFHEQWEKKGLKFPYFSNLIGGFHDEDQVIKATEEFYATAMAEAVEITFANREPGQISGKDFRDFYENHFPAGWYIEGLPTAAADDHDKWIMPDDEARPFAWFGEAVRSGDTDTDAGPRVAELSEKTEQDKFVDMDVLYAAVMADLAAEADKGLGR